MDIMPTIPNNMMYIIIVLNYIKEMKKMKMTRQQLENRLDNLYIEIANSNDYDLIDLLEFECRELAKKLEKIK
jgi:meiotically up-regulated gene 157 (Mug157) protein